MTRKWICSVCPQSLLFSVPCPLTVHTTFLPGPPPLGCYQPNVIISLQTSSSPKKTATNRGQPQAIWILLVGRKANFNLKKLIISMFQTGQAEMPESRGRARIKGTRWLVPLQPVGTEVIQGRDPGWESGDRGSEGPNPESWCCREKHASQRWH